MSMFDWWRARFSKAAPMTPPSENEAETRRFAEEQARRSVRAGYDTPDDIRERIVDGYRDELPEAALDSLASRAIADELDLLRREQSGWPAVTDYDRLQAAFDALEETGIVARENFACCNNCGNAEIGMEIDDAEQAGVTVRGYTFFHEQDTDSAVDGGGLYLSYGAVDDEEESSLGVARDIVAALKRSGLSPEWNGSWNKRVYVPMSWQRRL